MIIRFHRNGLELIIQLVDPKNELQIDNCSFNVNLQIETN